MNSNPLRVLNVNQIFQLVKSLWNVTAILKCYRVNVQNANSPQTDRSETASAFVFFKMTWYYVAES